MAQIHGNIANYPAAKRRELFLRMFVVVFIFVAIDAFVVGLSMGASLMPAIPPWGRILVTWGGTAMLLVGFLFAYRWLSRNEDPFFAFVEGARGETAVADQLAKLPASYHVFHGLKTPNGDVDHLVIGPSGVVVLDAKKWNGHVSVDQRGRLLYAGRPTDKDHVGQLQGTVRALRGLMITADGPDPYVQATFVFVETSIQIPQGSLGRTDAIMPDQLIPYLTRTHGRKGLMPQDIDLLAARAASHVRA